MIIWWCNNGDDHGDLVARGSVGQQVPEEAAEPRHQEQEAGQQGHQPAQAEVSLESATMGQLSVDPPWPSPGPRR